MAAGSPYDLDNIEWGFLTQSTGVLGIGGVDIGFLEEDIRVREEHETALLQPPQSVTPIDFSLTSRHLFVDAVASESRAENIQYAWNLSASAGVLLSVSRTAGTFGALLCTTGAPNGDTRVVSIPRAIGVNGSELTIPIDSHQTLGMTFQAIGDPAAYGLLGTIKDA